MPSETLTVKRIENFNPPKNGRLELWDEKETGLILRVTSAGSKTWAVQFKAPHEFDGKGRRKTKKLTLGPYPEINLSNARKKAREAKVLVADGKDPARVKIHSRQQKVADAKRLKVKTTTEAIDAFTRAQSGLSSKWKRYEVPRLLTVELAKSHGHLGIGEIEPSDLRKVRDRIHRRAPIMSNRFVAACRSFYRWAAKEYDLPDPSSGLASRVDEQEHRRDRWLNLEELRAVWSVSESLTPLSRDFIRTLILVPQRESAVAAMRRSQIDSTGIWKIPRQQKKQKVSVQQLPLPDAVKEIIKVRPSDWDHVFCSGRAGDKPISAFSKIKSALDAQLGDSIEPWRFHDFRRSFATWAAGEGIDQAVTRRILDHKQGFADPLEAIYNQHQYLDEQREALDAYAEAVML